MPTLKAIRSYVSPEMIFPPKNAQPSTSFITQESFNFQRKFKNVHAFVRNV